MNWVMLGDYYTIQKENKDICPEQMFMTEKPEALN